MYNLSLTSGNMQMELNSFHKVFLYEDYVNASLTENNSSWQLLLQVYYCITDCW